MANSSELFDDVSLNNSVQTCPDFANNLVAVLLKFRQHPVAIMADIEAMYYQVKVTPLDRDSLKFMWWEDVENQETVIVCRYTGHVFGGAWSPSAAMFALSCVPVVTKSYLQ